MPAKWPPPTMHMKIEGLVIVEGRGTPLDVSAIGGGLAGTGVSCLCLSTSTMSCCSCSVAVKRAR